MFKDLKIDFPAVLALVLVALFGLVLFVAAVFKIEIPQDLRGFLINLIMLIAGFYFRQVTMPQPPAPPPPSETQKQ